MKGKRGYTLIEIIVTVATIAILAAIAVPSYGNYVRRARISDAFNNLLALKAQMQIYATENRNYGASGCGVPMPSSKYFTFVCNINNSQQGFLITAKGSGDLLNYNFTVDNDGKRVTIDFPGVSGLPFACWIDRPGPC